MRSCLVAFLFVFTGIANANTIIANNTNAELAFAGEHAGMKFDGIFKKWQSQLVLPPAANPSIAATFELASAYTGDSTYDETLPESDWFDVENFPQASFNATSIGQVGSGYQVVGELILKGKTISVKFLLETKGSDLVANFIIDRLAFGIGLESDPEAEWVSREISMTLRIPAK